MEYFEELPPFLNKLIRLTQRTSDQIAKWNKEGSVFIILDDEEFRKTLKTYFKGTKQTFIRQLHFYGFKKVDTLEGMWGFIQEDQLFLRDKTSLVREIKRKKKVDPDTQRIATYTEVQTLRNQVGYCQELIEDLRTQIFILKGKLPFEDEDFLRQTQSRKRLRHNDNIDFHNICFNIDVHETLDSEMLCVPSFRNTKEIDSDLENLSELFVELDLEPIVSKQLERVPSYQQPLLNDNSIFLDAVEAVAEATNVKKDDVSKIISFLSQISRKGEYSSDSKKGVRTMSGHFHKARVQKVGAS